MNNTLKTWVPVKLPNANPKIPVAIANTKNVILLSHIFLSVFFCKDNLETDLFILTNH